MAIQSLSVSTQDNYPPQLKKLGGDIERSNTALAKLQRAFADIDDPDRFKPSDDRPYWEAKILILETQLALIPKVWKRPTDC